MKRSTIYWPAALKPLLKKYRSRKHPLEAANPYQWIVMVELSAQSTDNLINQIAPDFFKAFPDMRALAKADPELLFPYISKVRNFRHKAQWLVDTAKKIKSNNKIPLEIESLVELPGIGRKSANVIRRGSKAKPEGIIVDLHTTRVANRLGIVTDNKSGKNRKAINGIVTPKGMGCRYGHVVPGQGDLQAQT